MQDILKGMRIIEGSAFIAAPSGGMTLAQLGADVIRFDMIGGGLDYGRWPISSTGKSLYWHSLNKGKRSLAIDFRQPEGRELLTQLIAAPGETNGIFLSNFPARGWLADDQLRAHREDLIYISLAGDRHGGTALDYTVNSRVGLPYLFSEDSTPINNPFPAWDVIAGQHIALGILAAERQRRIEGKGQLIKLSLNDVAMATMGHLGYIMETEINLAERPYVGNHVYGSFGHDFACSDGRRVMVVGVSLSQWQALITATATAGDIKALEEKLSLDFNVEGHRFEAREELVQIFIPWFAARPYHAVTSALDAAGVCWGPYQTIAEMVHSDQECSETNPLFQRINQPGIGQVLTPGNPLEFSATSRTPLRPAPLLGEHTDEILSEVFGLDSGAIGRLHDRGIVSGPHPD